MSRFIFSIIWIAAVAMGCSRYESWTTESGLQVTEIREGTGPVAKQGEFILLHYTAWYLEGDRVESDQFDTTLNLDGPRKFLVGKSNLLPGLDEGIETMRKGGKRIFVLPPHLAFGEEGRPGVVPPGTWVKFEVELVDITPGPPKIRPWNDLGREMIATESGLQIIDFVVGEGEFPELGTTVVIDYSGFLDEQTCFDSSVYRGAPVEFVLDPDLLIPGMVEGLMSMQPGGKRKLVIPPFLGYGESGFGDEIPPNATLIYDIQLHEVK
jgi:FKBP-type peptidyl-prolyl cis-trans isomerase